MAAMFFSVVLRGLFWAEMVHMHCISMSTRCLLRGVAAVFPATLPATVSLLSTPHVPHPISSMSGRNMKVAGRAEGALGDNMARGQAGKPRSTKLPFTAWLED